MSDEITAPRKGQHFKGNSADGNARQQNGDQIYGTVQSVHQRDTYNTTQSGPIYVPRSGYLSAQRWLDEAKNNAALLEASKYGQLQRLGFLLKQPDKNVDYIDSDGRGALHYAVENGHLEAARMLIEQGGANPGLQKKVRTGLTPLILAVQRGDYETSKLLLKSGAPLDSPFPHWNRYTERFDVTNALTEAILSGIGDLVSLLLEHGASTKGNAWEVQPLTLAMIVGRPDLVDILLDNGATLDERRTCLWMAKSGSCTATPHSVARLLGTLVNQAKSLSLLQEAFHLAAFTENFTAMDCLLASGIDVDCEQLGRKALHLVSFFGITRSIDYLLGHGASIHQTDSDLLGQADPPWRIWLASDFQHSRGARQLERTGMRISVMSLTVAIDVAVIPTDCFIPSHTGGQPIHYAVSHPKIMSHLLERGASISAKCARVGYTPLHIATVQLDPDSARWLLAHGADMMSGCRERCVPYDIALQQHGNGNDESRRHRELLDILRIIPISDFKKVIQVDYTPKSRSRESNKSGNEGAEMRASNSSCALSERFSANSWALSERYSFRSQTDSKIYDMEEIAEEHALHGPLDETTSKRGKTHDPKEDIDGPPLEEVTELEEPGESGHVSSEIIPDESAAGNDVQTTARSKRYSRFFFD